MSTTRRIPPLTALAAILTVGTGAVDVASFTRLGGVFSSVMTGNLVVFGFAVGHARVAQLLNTAIAITGYALGVLGGTGITGRPRPDAPTWPVRVTAALAAELLVMSAYTVGWELTGGRPANGAQVALLTLASMAMGLQSAAMRGLGGKEAVSTTYLTGTLTGVIAALLTPDRLHRTHVRGIVILAALTAGAAVGALLIATVPAALPVIPLAALAVVITMAVIHHRATGHAG